jgi:nucleoid DNA-binding protein
MAENNAPKAMTKSAVYDEIAKNTDLSKKQIGEVFEALSCSSAS